MHVTARLVGALFGALLTAGVSYWAFNGRTSSVAPKNPPPLANPSQPPTATEVTPPVSSLASTALTEPLTAPQALDASPGPKSAPVPTPLTTGMPMPPEAPSAPVASLETSNCAASIVDRLPAQRDMSDADRRKVQEALVQLRYYQGPVDGKFGHLTRAAIRRYQQDVDAEVTGRLTESQANRLVSGDVPNPKISFGLK